MRISNLLVFDDMISGTGTTWYSRSDFNQQIGRADFFAVQAYVTSLTGTTPKLTVASQHSTDSQVWSPTNVTEINNVTIAQNTAYAGSNVGSNGTLVLAPNVRLGISLGGTTPQCRLKLYVTCRTA